MVPQETLAKIKLLVCDVDGVLTDGTIIYSSSNAELKAFNIKDGLGIKLGGWCGLPVIWLTGRKSIAVARRADELGVQVYQAATDKEAGLQHVASDHRLSLDEIAYLGDDLNDLPAMRRAGLPIAVADAVPEIIASAAYVTQATGGHGAVREVIELILRGQQRWEAAIDCYLENSRAVKAAAQ